YLFTFEVNESAARRGTRGRGEATGLPGGEEAAQPHVGARPRGTARPPADLAANDERYVFLLSSRPSLPAMAAHDGGCRHRRVIQVLGRRVLVGDGQGIAIRAGAVGVRGV